MLILGLQGSPRKNGNTTFLLQTFMQAAERMGARTLTVDVPRRNITPCKEYIVCEKKGFCPIDDDMKHDIYPLLRQADVVVAASPIFFYNCTAQLKALIDRCQTLWARKYRLKLADPGQKQRRGFLLAVGATGGKNLFEGLHLTMQYFFDAVGAEYAGSLTYRKIEHKNDMAAHQGVRQDVAAAVETLLAPLLGRSKIMFLCRENACRSQMASAFARFLAGRRVDVASGGSSPADEVNADMVRVMAEKGIDMAFRRPQSIDAALSDLADPDIIVSMGCGDRCPVVPGATVIDWDLPDPAGQSREVMRRIRDDIDQRVKDLVAGL